MGPILLNLSLLYYLENQLVCLCSSRPSLIFADEARTLLRESVYHACDNVGCDEVEFDSSSVTSLDVTSWSVADSCDKLKV